MPRFVALAGVVLGCCVLAGPVVAQQPPGFPALFFGSVAIDGQPPPEGSRVTAFIDGVDCTQSNSGRTVVSDGVGAYSVTVMHENQRAGCGAPGKTVAFRVAERPAVQTASWVAGSNELNLSVGSATPPPLPSPTALPTPGETAVAATQTHVAQFTPAAPPSALPTDDPGVIGGGSGSATRESTGVAPDTTASPLPGGTGDTDDGGVAPWTYAVLAVIAAGGVAGGFLLSRRKRRVSTP